MDFRVPDDESEWLRAIDEYQTSARHRSGCSTSLAASDRQPLGSDEAVIVSHTRTTGIVSGLAAFMVGIVASVVNAL